MKKIYFVFLAMLCMGAYTLQAQSWYSSLPVVSVAPDPGGIPPSTGNGALRDAVSATGASAIYELERGGVYFVNATCAFGATDAVVRAKAGTGPRPVVVPYTVSGTSNDVFSGTGNLRLENLYVYALEPGGVTRRAVLRMSVGTGNDYEFENCFFDGGSSASVLRFENLNGDGTNPPSLTVNNCILRNSVDYANVGNARGVDLRDSKNFNATITNCTFYSISAQTLRLGTNHDAADVIVFENNTIYGAAAAFDLGTTGQASVKNNIFYNMVLNGSTADAAGIITFTSSDYPREGITIANNLFYRDPEFDALVPQTPPRYLTTNVFDTQGYSLVDNGEVVVSDTLSYAIDFKNPPASVFPFYQYLWANDIPGTAIPAEDQTFIRREVTPPPFVGDVLGSVAPYDFSYPKSSPAATAGEGGTYLGAWAPNSGEAISPINANNVINCWFDVNAKTLNMTLGSSVPIVKVSIYTLTGALVANQLVTTNGKTAEFMPAGLSNGVYLYVVEIPDGVMTRGKFVY